MNGRNDAANSIATIVSTRVLAPRYAVAWAAFFNFVAFLVFGLHVATTIGTGIIAPATHHRCGDLRRADGRDLLADHHRLFRHSLVQLSHALIGGLVGAGVAHAGFGVIVWNGLGKTAGAIVLSPVTGLAIALLLVLLVSWAFVRVAPARVDGIFRKVQFVSASLYSLGHGGNDAQKTMGIIAALLFAHGQLAGRVSRAVLGGDRLQRRHGAGHAAWAAGASCVLWVRESPGWRPFRASARKRRDR